MTETEHKFTRGTVWWCNLPTRLDTNIQGGKRTVLIVSSDNRGDKSTCFEVLAMTASPKPKMSVNVPVKVKGKTCTVLATQHFTVDEKDMESYACTLTAAELEKVEKAMLIAQGMEKYTKKAAAPISHDTYPTMSDDDVRMQLAVASAQLKVYKQQNDALLHKIDLSSIADIQKSVVEKEEEIKSKEIQIAVLQEKLRESENRLAYFTDLVIKSGVFDIGRVSESRGVDIVKHDECSTSVAVKEKGIVEEKVDEINDDENTPIEESKYCLTEQGTIEEVEEKEDPIVEEMLQSYRSKGYKPAGFWDSDAVKRAYFKDYTEKPMEYVLERWGLKNKHSASQTFYTIRKRLANSK